jgi:hypothetical protein
MSRTHTNPQLCDWKYPRHLRILEFERFQPIWYYELNVFSQQNKLMVRWLGVAHHVSQAMCFWILPSSGMPIARTIIQEGMEEEINDDLMKQQLDESDKRLGEKFNNNKNELISLSLYRE